MLSVLFTPLPKMPRGQKKQRADAKPPSMTKVAYIYEDYELKDFLAFVICHTLKHPDLLKNFSLYSGHEHDDPDLFLLTYTIPCTNLLKVSIDMKTCETDYAEMVEQATKKGKPTIKIEITESKVCPGVFLLFIILFLVKACSQ
jgi:hypothetical protein